MPDGSTLIGSVAIPVEIADGRGVVRLKSIADYETLVRCQRHGLLWQRANPRLEDARAQMGQLNRPPLPESPRTEEECACWHH